MKNKILTIATIALSFNLITNFPISERGSWGVFAQQVPMYSLYYYNQFIYNPALAGANANGSLYLLNRNQWTGIPEAPKTKLVTLEGRMKDPRVGLGFNAYNDVAGIFNKTAASVSYAYMIKINDKQNLRFGLSGGFFDNRINFANITVKQKNDQLVFTEAPQRQTTLDGSFGLAYNYEKLQVGVAIPHLFGNKINYLDKQKSLTEYTLARQFIVSAKYDLFEMTYTASNGNTENLIRVTPLIFARITPNAPFQFDINIMSLYKERIWGAIMYRHTYGISASAGVKLFNQWSIGYAYDFPISMPSNAADFVGGTHEVMLGYTFGKKAADNSDLEKRIKELEDKVNKHDKDIDTLKNKSKDHDKRIEQNEKDIKELKGNFNDFKEMMERDVNKLKEKGSDTRNDENEKKYRTDYKTVRVGDKFEFDNINFKFGSWEIPTNAYTELNDLADVMKKNSDMEIEIDGNADEIGSAEINMKVSQARANGIRDYLVSKGVPENRITTKAFGSAKPLDTHHTGAARSKNRRVEFMIMKK